MVTLLIHNPLKAQLTETSFGGNPVKNKFEKFNWPICTSCKLPMQFLGKIASGNYLYQIFMCQNDPGCCEEWDPEDGGNKVLITIASTLEIVPTPSEGLTTRGIEHSISTATIHVDDYNEARDKWANENNGNYREVLGQIHGSPWWLQGEEVPNCTNCNAPMQFLAQLEEGPESNTAMNFGSGVGYVFNCKCGESAKFLWQC